MIAHRCRNLVKRYLFNLYCSPCPVSRAQSYKGADVDSLAQSPSSNVTTQEPPLDASTSTFVSGKGWERTPAISNTSSDTADILRLNEEIDSEAKAALPESFDGFDELSFVIGEQVTRESAGPHA